MSETTSTTVEIPEIVRPMFSILKSFAENANALQAEIANATGKKDDAIESTLNSSDDEKIVAWREKDAEIRAKIKQGEEMLARNREAAETYALSILPGTDANFNVEEKTAEFMEARRKVTTMKKTLRDVLGDDAILEAGCEQFNIVEVKGIRKGAAATGARKPRISAAEVDGENVANSDGKVSFTTLNAFLHSDLTELRNAAVKAAGTDDFKSLNGQPFTFEFSVKGKSHTITLTPAVPAAKVSAEENSEEDSSEENTED